MRHRIFLVVAAALLSVPITSVDADEVSGRSFLWKVTGGPRTVHLLGSIHFMKDEAYPLSPAIEQAYASSGLVVFETDMAGLGEAAVKLMAAGGLDDGRTLADAAGPELYRLVSERFDAMGMDTAAFDGMKPWMVALSLTSIELMRAGYLGSEGLDAHFSERANADGKPTRGLETPEFQVSLFADLSEQEGREFLAYSLEDLETVIPLVDEIVVAWSAGDVDRIEELLTEGFHEHPEPVSYTHLRAHET